VIEPGAGPFPPPAPGTPKWAPPLAWAFRAGLEARVAELEQALVTVAIDRARLGVEVQALKREREHLAARTERYRLAWMSARSRAAMHAATLHGYPS
jgi:phage shock protein A